MRCVLNMSSSPSFILKHGRFGVGKLGNIHEPPMHAAMHQLVEAGPRWQQHGGATTPRWDQLVTAFAWLVPGWP